MGVGIYFGQMRVWFFFRLERGGIELFSCLTENIFNKCHKKAVFMKNNWIWVNKIARAGVDFFYKLEGGNFLREVQGGSVIFFLNRQPNFPNPHPPTSIKWWLPSSELHDGSGDAVKSWQTLNSQCQPSLNM